MRILLVEDEAPLRETLAARLKREGFAVDAAQDGEEGLYMGREVPFDVGIIDLGLPKMSGMELVKQLREEGKQRSEEHTSELQSLLRSSYAVFCLKKKNHIEITIKNPRNAD